MSAETIRGHIDSTGGGVVAGWIADATGRPVAVTLLIDDIVVASGTAGLFRQDLLDVGIGTGSHGFVLAIPAFFDDGQPHAVVVEGPGGGRLYPDPPNAVLTVPPASSAPTPPDLPSPPLPPAPPPPTVTAPPRAPTIGKAPEISVIIPTYGRGAVMEATVLRMLACASTVSAEIVVIDDGSHDDTPDRLRRLAAAHPALVTHRVENGGPARARNIGATMARGRILVFAGDDVSPPGDEFLSVHAAAHTRFPDIGTAILGKIAWPDYDQLPVNAVMAHVQGEGEQQFGFYNMVGYSWYDWRLFYSSNVSVKKALVPDWLTQGYDATFPLAAYEDPEFALRTTLRLAEAGESFRLFYVPAANLVHHHPYSLAGFIARQVSVGMMAQRFLELHPARAGDLGLAAIVTRMATASDGPGLPVEHYFSVFEGLKSWALVIEHHYGLGQQNWHADLMRAVFRLAYLEGFLRAQRGAQTNVAAGARYMIEEVRSAMNRTIATEVLGALPGFGLV